MGYAIKLKDVKNIKIKEITLGVIISISMTILCIFFFALILKFIDVNSTTILVVNQLIKVLSLLIGSLYISKKFNLDCFKSSLIGIFYSIIAFLIFSLLSGIFILDISVFIDVLFCLVVGFILGIIIKNRN